ncbi:hypothetical protein [Rhizobium cremeum]|uniref:hypothetical protein n=1 Tax=Rhizobium cremeum TaxID=2813827 RepID=UPI0039E188BB
MLHLDLPAVSNGIYAHLEHKCSQRKPADAGDADLESFVTDCKHIHRRIGTHLASSPVGEDALDVWKTRENQMLGSTI